MFVAESCSESGVVSEGHLGHVTRIMSSDFHFLVPESFHKKFVQIGKVVSAKIRF